MAILAVTTCISCSSFSHLKGNDADITTADLWHLGSITKSMTATLVARLVEQEVISFDDTLQGVLGEEVPDMHADYRDVTLVHLLSHRAGLTANIPMNRFLEFGQTPEDPIADRLKWVRIALAETPRGPKGEHFEYSNNGFIIVGAMLEAATDTSWEKLMEREAFDRKTGTVAAIVVNDGDLATVVPPVTALLQKLIKE